MDAKRLEREGRAVKLYRGRLFDHVQLTVRDLLASRRFYEAALGALGVEVQEVGEHAFYADELWVTDQGELTGRMHFAFQADGPEAVQRFYAAALEAGGRDNGAPGERAYHPGYYAAYVLDPDGNNVEAVYHGPARRSTPVIELDIGPPS